MLNNILPYWFKNKIPMHNMLVNLKYYLYYFKQFQNIRDTKTDFMIYDMYYISRILRGCNSRIKKHVKVILIV